MHRYFSNVLAAYYFFRKYSALRNVLRKGDWGLVIRRVSYMVTNKTKRPSDFLWNLIFEVMDKFRRPN
jgi:hypothetical protein